nr:NAD-binding protein [Pseudonocardia sp. SCN 73-27]
MIRDDCSKGLREVDEAIPTLVLSASIDGKDATDAKAILDGDWSPSFSAANAAKDSGLIVDAATAAGVRLDVAAAARDRLRRVSDAGHADDDMAAAYLASFMEEVSE